ncbi:MAG TPA: sulfotransferase domain-containing protein [Chthoniobacterales bacterium]|nr:sulfotransferase domain-containing protein [Chthoniobacterales bacterium]
MLFRRRYPEPGKNVVAFTVHKAGSMVLHRVLRDTCEHNAIEYHSENGPNPKLPARKIFKGQDYIAKHTGCFGPIRYFVPSRSLADARVLLHLRDPRDVLTSMFFSYCFAHRGPVAGNTGVRKEVAERGIDKFVLDMSSDASADYEGDYGTGGPYREYIGNMAARYDRYLRELIGRPNTLVVSYEEMVLDFSSWLRKVISRFELQDAEETYRIVSERYAESVKPQGEDIFSHKRKVVPGDYKEKLQPETIAELNHRFSEVLDALGYSCSEYEARRIPACQHGALQR